MLRTQRGVPTAEPAGPDGLVVVDKPVGLTSHDVVARVRRLAGTRKVGHAGTLDPSASGVLVLGLGRATRLLGHLALADKTYLATVRLGMATTTDDADGEPLGGSSTAGLSDDVVRSAVAGMVGELDQVPSAVSAVKVGGVRSYARVRAGETVELAPRRVTVTAFDVLDLRRPTTELLDLDVAVTCSTGTYVRALARDLGAALGVGGHLTALRRTRVGRFDLGQARTLDEMADGVDLVSLDDAVGAAFRRVDVDADAAADVRHGRTLEAGAARDADDPVGVFGPDGSVLAVMAVRDGRLRPLVVLAPA
jgi:tRNA pseudouridine55 synthase